MRNVSIKRLASRTFLCVLCASLLNASADEVDDVIAAQMQQCHIYGLSLAIVQDGKITEAKGYGFTDKTGKTPVTPETLFQAGSVSKSVAAFGALHLVQEGKLSLDADVNTELRTWKVPESEFTKDKKVTLREILSHSAGLTVHGFPGYPVDAAVPTLVEVLDGTKPANTVPIRVDIAPGSLWRYSGGGYTVMQQMVIDATGKSFPGFMNDTVLKPLGMTSSTYEQPLPRAMAAMTAKGYFSDGHG
jgi:CubicO group peptidase (beta-lactamase class C family)